MFQWVPPSQLNEEGRGVLLEALRRRYVEAAADARKRAGLAVDDIMRAYELDYASRVEGYVRGEEEPET